MSILHKISHLLGWNKGRPDAFYHRDKLMMSFLCECGERSGVHQIDDVIDREIKEELKKRRKKIV